MFYEADITAFRHAPWGGDTTDGDFIREGEDLSGATFVFSIATAPGAAVSKTITNATAGSEGVSATYDANYLNSEGTQVGATTIRVQLGETAMEALPVASSSSDDKILYYDLLVTPSGGSQRVLCYGTFTVKPGVGD